MFDLSVGKILVLIVVGIIVVGPDRLPKLAKDAGQILRTLRELATGARNQLRDELGPEFADIDLQNLNPRSVVQRTVFGDEVDLAQLDPRAAVRKVLFGDPDLAAADPRISLRDLAEGQPPSEVTATNPMPPRPRPKPGPAATAGR